MLAKSKGKIVRVSNWKDDTGADKTTLIVLVYDKKDLTGYVNPCLHKLTRDASDVLTLCVEDDVFCSFEVVAGKGGELKLRLTGVCDDE